tara:strand:- start:2174 stop:2656 length:483 start_codon:yes stop_codon:yes gene_type:complete
VSKLLIDIFDNQIKDKEKIYKELLSYDYFYGETDNLNQAPTGMVSDLNKKQYTFKIIDKFCKKQDYLENLKLVRAYVNIFSPREYCFFHSDEDANKTLIYYPNLDWDLNEGGETKFVSDNNTLVSVLPVPGRIIIFDSKIVHCATSFKDRHRFSVVFKFR